MDLTARSPRRSATTGPVTIAGLSTRGRTGAGRADRCRAPAGIEWIQADEMTMSLRRRARRSTTLDAALAEVGQRVALPPGGTVGGALAVGRSGLRRLGDGLVRDVLLQAKLRVGRGRGRARPADRR